MICFFLIVFLGVFRVNALDGNERSIFNRRQPQNAPMNVNDADNWDAFDWRLLKAVLLKDYNNTIISPFYVKLVLAALNEAAGRGTETSEELNSVLPQLNSYVRVREHNKKTLDSLKEERVHHELNFGSRIFTDQLFRIRQRFAAIIKTHYDTEIQPVDFHNTVRLAQLINNWGYNITAGHIRDLVSSDDLISSVMLMFNVIYFDGVWEHPFPENNIHELPFFISPSDQVGAKFMTQTNSFYHFEATRLNAQLLRLPYKGKKLAMTILLPNAKAGLEELIREIEGDTIRRLQWLMDERVVKVTIPKFKFDYTSHLKEILQSLGIKEIFTSRASLPGLVRGARQKTLKVSNIIQKSGINVHEKGSTASAATEVSTNTFGGSTVTEFNLNRPFVFFIEDESTGTMLFAGKVTNPTI